MLLQANPSNAPGTASPLGHVIRSSFRPALCCPGAVRVCVLSQVGIHLVVAVRAETMPAPRAINRICAPSTQFAAELHGLASLNAAYHGLALASPSGADRCSLSWWGWAPPAAHLPLHVAAAQRLLALAVLAKAADQATSW